ncbi:hypothetical protein AVEN_205561-1 [Araneus ventricosus]|uniref:Uncharacterized protein n=1 Tax=Araneus ventricosus TaxID=182803 RepID=A0A4Y2H017_ARAVE|nr:hypothetical protein AVEN_260466-1 [Araneus ventricosus]GBM59592.1 hypothetical protein AVEN_168301-1 [Araneus ventricosus]GBM59597.1 hypothetical protein AVEN_171109-1 [Araneus ventricosus]GBM59613.1 hypothetical protein AVEN_205561-1 [Araneus ventricosus]
MRECLFWVRNEPFYWSLAHEKPAAYEKDKLCTRCLRYLKWLPCKFFKLKRTSATSLSSKREPSSYACSQNVRNIRFLKFQNEFSPQNVPSSTEAYRSTAVLNKSDRKLSELYNTELKRLAKSEGRQVSPAAALTNKYLKKIQG